MRKIVLYIIPGLLIAACNNKKLDKPVWVNQSDTLSLPGKALLFSAKEKNWKAVLQTMTHPVPLITIYKSGKLLVTTENNSGITGGPAQICLFRGTNYFFYPVYLENSSFHPLTKEYRSPKTVNPDSSLLQQRIVYTIDEHRNISAGKKDYFFEEEIQLAPKAGIYRAIKDEPLTAYYVQEGSCTGIPLQSGFLKEENAYRVTAGPLKDKYGNTVANGTLVAFNYSDGKYVWRTEAALQDGYAYLLIPAERDKKYSVNAKVNEAISKTIQLNL